MKPSPAFRAINFIITIAALLLASGSLTALIMITLQVAYGLPESDQRTYYIRMAQISTALLALCLILLAWVLVRHLRRPERTERTQTPYVDAWAEAGRRFRFDEEDELGIDKDDVPIELDDEDQDEADDDDDSGDDDYDETGESKP